MFSCTGINHDGRDQMINLEMFTKVFYLLDFDLKERLITNISFLLQGKARIEAHFKKRLPKPVTWNFVLNILGTSKSTTPENLQYN